MSKIEWGIFIAFAIGGVFLLAQHTSNVVNSGGITGLPPNAVNPGYKGNVNVAPVTQ